MRQNRVSNSHGLPKMSTFLLGFTENRLLSPVYCSIISRTKIYILTFIGKRKCFRTFLLAIIFLYDWRILRRNGMKEVYFWVLSSQMQNKNATSHDLTSSSLCVSRDVNVSTCSYLHSSHVSVVSNNFFKLSRSIRVILPYRGCDSIIRIRK